MDMFTECLVKRKKGAKEHVLNVLMILGGIGGSLLYLMYRYAIFGGMLSGVLFAVAVLMWWAICLFIGNQNKEFEYTVTNKYVDIDVIYSQKKRKQIASFKAGDIEKMAPIEQLDPGESFRAEIDASAHNDKFDVYYISVNLKGVKTKILVNPSRKMLDILKTYKPDSIVIGEDNE